ncbi:MAG: hypothetical protein LPK19_12750 [Hymenobacteraceae bacterium]|nr:hypothetical protein [Hymenobacteraceae bacterium]MDX5397090.1 hypothetical protein [Hymenobacteraceae bacterium]MDX5513168.1 hypothetical protein [Hymenobacteraceae bacterium]
MQDANRNQQQGNQNRNQNNSNNDSLVGQLIQPQDISQTVESAVHVMQGRTDKLPDLMKHSSNILVKASERMTTTQLIVAVGLLAVGALWLAKKANEQHEQEQ